MRFHQPPPIFADPQLNEDGDRLIIGEEGLQVLPGLRFNLVCGETASHRIVNPKFSVRTRADQPFFAKAKNGQPVFRARNSTGE